MEMDLARVLSFFLSDNWPVVRKRELLSILSDTVLSFACRKSFFTFVRWWFVENLSQAKVVAVKVRAVKLKGNDMCLESV